MLRLVPARVQEICSLLAMVQVAKLFRLKGTKATSVWLTILWCVQDGKAKRQDMTGAAAAVGDEDAPEHLFLRWL